MFNLFNLYADKIFPQKLSSWRRCSRITTIHSHFIDTFFSKYPDHNHNRNHKRSLRRAYTFIFMFSYLLFIW